MVDLFSSLKYGFLLWEGQQTMIYNSTQFYSYSLIYTPTVEWIVAELPTVANTTSTPPGVEGEEPQSDGQRLHQH